MRPDEDAITDLIHRYAELLDAGDLDAVGNLFERATLRSNLAPEAAMRGAEQVADLYRGTVILYDGSPCTKHVTTNLIVEVDAGGAAASARSYFTVLQACPELPLQAIIAGRYHDRFACSDGVWHFADRLIIIDLAGDLRFHLKVPLPAGR